MSSGIDWAVGYVRQRRTPLPPGANPVSIFNSNDDESNSNKGVSPELPAFGYWYTSNVYSLTHPLALDAGAYNKSVDDQFRNCIALLLNWVSLTGSLICTVFKIFLHLDMAHNLATPCRLSDRGYLGRKPDWCEKGVLLYEWSWWRSVVHDS